MYLFGIGNLYGLRTDVTPNVPTFFGNIQDVSLDFTFNEKELYGQYQFPVAIARGQGKMQGKAKWAHINGKLYNDFFFGQTYAAGQTNTANAEAHAIPTTPYQVTIAPPNSGTFGTDLGVVFTATQIPLIRVASSPATGQYSVSAGVYTFAAADTGLNVQISYTYTMTGGATITGTNLVLGSSPFFQLTWNITYNNKQITVTLNNCVSTKLNLPAKLEDFTIPEFDFSAFADSGNNLFTIGLSE